MQASLLRALFMVVMLYVPDRYAMRLRFKKPCALTVAQVLEHSRQSDDVPRAKQMHGHLTGSRLADRSN